MHHANCTCRTCNLTLTPDETFRLAGFMAERGHPEEARRLAAGAIAGAFTGVLLAGEKWPAENGEVK